MRTSVTLLGAVAACMATVGAASVSARGVSGGATAEQRRRIEAKAKVLGLGLAPDEVPQPLKITRPDYPDAALDSCIEGTVVVLIVISDTGRVAEAEVLEPTAGLDEAALQCVKSWRFRPARRAGKAVGYIGLAPVVFRIDDDRHEGCPDTTRAPMQ